ncbi:MAG TPA: aminotransferase class I/II-fold pyridoxal phosphate-dependent enzyme [Bacteroidetes bacterium]|nr:aminotransferase class I/II-fold pyridoxal phosphate-dependent enzyme [Bacteroidota bacterium]
MHLSEILTHFGEERKNYFNAVAPPVIQSSNFAFDNIADFRKAISDELNHHLYTRGNNPTVEILRKKVAALEGAEDALIVASGAGAIAMAIMANIKTGDHIVCVQSPYSWTKNLLAGYLPRFGVSHTFVDGRYLEEIEKAIRPETSVLFLESPNSMTFELQDLRGCAQIAKRHGLVSIIDNANCSPIFQRPIEHGIDLVVHTGTKYLNGHSDVVNGVVCGSKKMIQKIFSSEMMTLGNIISPHDAWLIIRGLRTLEMRVKKSFESALKIAEWLERHPKIEKVLFPFLPSFPQFELAKKQMDGCAGLFTVFLKTEKIEVAEAFFAKLKRFLFAVSWGGHESLVVPTAAFYNVPGKEPPPYPVNMLRFYVGLEDPDWLIADLEEALKVV